MTDGSQQRDRKSDADDGAGNPAAYAGKKPAQPNKRNHAAASSTPKRIVHVTPTSFSISRSCVAMTIALPISSIHAEERPQRDARLFADPRGRWARRPKSNRDCPRARARTPRVAPARRKALRAAFLPVLPIRSDPAQPGRARAATAAAPCSSKGASTFSTAESAASSVWFWKTNATCRGRSSARPDRPGHSIEPALGTSRPPSSCNSVDLPLPEGPKRPMRSRARIVQLASFTATGFRTPFEMRATRAWHARNWLATFDASSREVECCGRPSGSALRCGWQ